MMKIQLNPEKTIRKKSSIHSLLNQNDESTQQQPQYPASIPVEDIRTHFNYQDFINEPIHYSTTNYNYQTSSLQSIAHPNNTEIAKQESKTIHFHQSKFSSQIKQTHRSSPNIHNWTFNGAKKFTKSKYPKTNNDVVTSTSKDQPSLNK